jgi:hypothetical protein
MTQQMHPAAAEGFAHGLDLADVAPQGPQLRIVGAVGGAGAELIMDDHAEAVLRQDMEGVPHAPRREAGAAVDAQHRLGMALAVDIGNDVAAFDGKARHAVGGRPR